MLDESGELPTHLSADADADHEQETHINRMYLTFSWWLLNKGWQSLSHQIEAAVLKVFDTINPRADLSLAELSELIGQVQYLIDYPDATSTTSQDFLTTLLPPPELETYVVSQTVNSGSGTADGDDGMPAVLEGPLRELLDETADFIESPNASEVIKRLVHTGLAVTVNKISTMYPQSDPGAGLITSPPPSTTNLTSPTSGEDAPGSNSPIPSPTGSSSAAAKNLFMPRVKLASLLANLTRQAAQMGQGTPFEPNEYVLAMTQVGDLDAFSAVVYSNFDWRKLE